MTKGRGVAFLLSYNLKEGAGNENWLIALLGETDFTERYNVGIYQPDIFPNERIFSSFLNDKLKNIKIYDYHDYIHKIDFLNRNKLSNILLESLLRPLFIRFSSITLYRELTSEIGRSDIVYLFYNDYIGLIKGTPQLVIGTTHDWYHRLTNIFGNIRLKLISIGLFWHKINSSNFFTESSVSRIDTRHFKTDVIKVCRDSSPFYPVNQKESHKVVFAFVGRLVECKGVIEAISAWNKADINRESELHIIGTDPLYEEILKISNETIFVRGSVVLEELSSLLSKCDTSGATVTEVALSGAYIFFSNTLEGEFDDLEDHKILEYIEPSVDALKSSIQESNKNGKRSITKKQEAHSFIKESYDVNIMGHKLSNFIESNMAYNFSSAEYDSDALNVR